MKTKKILLGTLLVLILSALYHDIYELFPNTITSFFFPIDESIWEHNKMILLAFITWAILEKISIKSSKNSLFKNLVACVTTIILVLTIFTPVFLFLLNKNDNLFVTLTIYTISIVIGFTLSEKIDLVDCPKLEFLSSIGFALLVVTFAIMTYYHPDNILFEDYTKISNRQTR